MGGLRFFLCFNKLPGQARMLRLKMDHTLSSNDLKQRNHFLALIFKTYFKMTQSRGNGHENSGF
jgi:hypothetical protein